MPKPLSVMSPCKNNKAGNKPSLNNIKFLWDWENTERRSVEMKITRPVLILSTDDFNCPSERKKPQQQFITYGSLLDGVADKSNHINMTFSWWTWSSAFASPLLIDFKSKKKNLFFFPYHRSDLWRWSLSRKMSFGLMICCRVGLTSR